MTNVGRQGYRAFLAYSHRDGRRAKRLHRALESHRIDKDLVGRETPAGPVPTTLRPIFRDREDFAAGHSLTEQSLAALRASRFLIVMCSPAAANSHYVNEEVRQFKAMGRADAIIPVIVDGEPGDAERECFPPALRFEVDADGNVTDRPTEVLAADVREAGDGWGLALAKVVAALLGLGTDEVYRRSERERRRQQRIRSGFAAAVLLILVFGGVFAWQNHQKQQTLAEIEALVAQYAPVSEAGDPAPGAQQSLTEAITSIAQGAASDPRYRQALDLLKAGRPAEAEPLLKAVAEDKKKQAARQSREAAEAFRNLAAIARVSDPANARKYYAEAVSLDPDHVEGMYWHGSMQSDAGNLQEAETAFRRVIRPGQEGRNDTWLYWARLGIGDLLVQRGDLNGAEVEFGTGRDFAEKLAAQDPNNTGWQRDLTVSSIKIGDVQRARGKLDAALKAYEDGLDIREKLAAQDPSNTDWQRDLWVLMWRFAQMEGGGVSWADVLARMEAMKARGVLLPTDEPFLEQARTLAAGN
jgi:tetratricopeptide (TPR) repeat protein